MSKIHSYESILRTMVDGILALDQDDINYQHDKEAEISWGVTLVTALGDENADRDMYQSYYDAEERSGHLHYRGGRG